MFNGWMTLAWKPLLVRGIIGIIFGVVAMVWPEPTLRALGVLWGVWALADGGASIAQAFTSRQGWARVGLIGLGVISLAAGILAILLPGLTVAALTWILGVWLIARGATELVGAFTVSVQSHRALAVLSGVVDGVIGVVLMANPGRAALSVAFFVGLMAVIWGLVFTGWALATRRNSDASADPPRNVSPA